MDIIDRLLLTSILTMITGYCWWRATSEGSKVNTISSSVSVVGFVCSVFFSLAWIWT